ncbi:hypothetical protein [Bacteroides sp.]|uniref:hypothetical protein n=1 Tax=Bacteroides TaxID=816 RepID=UPI0025BD8958|nr:hypothetical protein [Bacteroides sp.]
MEKIKELPSYTAMTAEEKKQIVGFTAEEYAAQEAKYGKRLRMVTVVTDDGRADFLVIRPSRQHMMLVASKGKDGDYEAANNVLINNCVVAGNRELIDEDFAVYSTVLQVLQQLTEANQAFFRKA